MDAWIRALELDRVLEMHARCIPIRVAFRIGSLSRAMQQHLAEKRVRGGVERIDLDGSAQVKDGLVELVPLGVAPSDVVVRLFVDDREIDLGDIDVTAGRRLRGSVVDAAGIPVAGASILVQHA